jgi:hypothetical protein
MKLNPRRELALKKVEWFIPVNVDWKSEKTILNDGQIGIINIQDDSAGTSAEEAFFNKTERGRLPSKINNLPRLRALLWGHKWLAAHEKMWREGLLEVPKYMRPFLVEEDFRDEPDYVKEMINKIFKNIMDQ